MRCWHLSYFPFPLNPGPAQASGKILDWLHSLPLGKEWRNSSRRMERAERTSDRTIAKRHQSSSVRFARIGFYPGAVLPTYLTHSLTHSKGARKRRRGIALGASSLHLQGAPSALGGRETVPHTPWRDSTMNRRSRAAVPWLPRFGFRAPRPSLSSSP